MSNLNTIKSRIYALEGLKVQVDSWKETGEKVVFTNGCFDILHRGHIELFRYAKSLGNKLIVGLDTDEKIRTTKGEDRPFNTLEDRKFVLSSIKYIDELRRLRK